MFKINYKVSEEKATKLKQKKEKIEKRKFLRSQTFTTGECIKYVADNYIYIKKYLGFTKTGAKGYETRFKGIDLVVGNYDSGTYVAVADKRNPASILLSLPKELFEKVSS